MDEVRITPKFPDLPPKPATAAEIDRTLEPILGALLSPVGFEPLPRGRRWVRARPPLRDIFEVAPAKGTSLLSHWGVSLDFVPHVQGKSVGWHRTNKSARMDILCGPRDLFEDSRAWEIQAFQGETGVQRDAARILPRAVALALEWFATFSASNLLERIEQHRSAERPANALKFENRTQQPLAYAFLLARAGRMDEAVAVLDRATTQFVAPSAAEQLRELLRASE